MSSMEKKTNDNEEQALALLCGSDYPWTWGGDSGICNIYFERDGTGAVSLPLLPCSRVYLTRMYSK